MNFGSRIGDWGFIRTARAERRALSFLALLVMVFSVWADPISAPVRTYQWGRDFLGAATIEDARAVLRAEMQYRINILNYAGVDRTGVTNISSIVQQALSDLGANGGEIFFPPGKYKFNLVVTNQNITFRGSSHQVDSTLSTTNCFIAATNSAPLIQFGNDTARQKGIILDHVTLAGNLTAATGLYLYGGPFEVTIRNSVISYFTNCVKIEGGPTNATSLVWLERTDIQAANVENARGILVQQTTNYPTSWTTAIRLVNSHVQGPSSGTGSYSVELDSATLSLIASTIDQFDDHGVKIAKSQAQLPYIFFSEGVIDTSPGVGAAIESYSTNRYLTDQIGGIYAIAGKWKTADGTLLTLSRAAFGDNAMLTYPVVFQKLQILGPDEDYRGGYWTNHNFFAAGGNLFLSEAGVFTMNLGGGRFQPGTDNSTDSGGASTRWKTVRTYKVQQPTPTISATDIDWRAGNTFFKSISGNTTFTFSNATAGDWITVRVTATGAFTATWPTVTWQAAATPAQTASKTDFYYFYYDGTTFFGRAEQNF